MEIEFRGIPEGKKEFVYGNLVKNQVCDRIIELHGDFYTVIPETIGQYTNLKDVDGNKIFFGDVLRAYGGECYQGVWEYNSIGICVFAGGSFCLKSEENTHYQLSHIYILEIIGNIHQDKNLLK